MADHKGPLSSTLLLAFAVGTYDPPPIPTRVYDTPAFRPKGFAEGAPSVPTTGQLWPRGNLSSRSSSEQPSPVWWTIEEGGGVPEGAEVGNYVLEKDTGNVYQVVE